MSFLLIQSVCADSQSDQSATPGHHPRSATRSASTRRDPPIPEPDVFDGDVEKCRGFLLQCCSAACSVFDHQPRTFLTEREKISYVINRLQGKALIWTKLYGQISWYLLKDEAQHFGPFEDE
uniref:DUF4939 domain-containing protein n=1 Tax=Monopterus albus TaxID=43700 RepID=A0A3Q3K890_MONAL